MNVEIYSKPNCHFCDKAIALAKLKKCNLTVYKLNVDYTMEDLFNKFPTAKTFPQIMVEGERLGGYLEFDLYVKVHK
jgi:glutaredoxin 3